MIHIVLLSGGSGTRLWPLSNEARSKQFLKVLRTHSGMSESMVQRTARGIARALDSRDGVDKCDVSVVTGQSQVYSIESQLEGIIEVDVVQEPSRRDTAPAIVLAVSHLLNNASASSDDPVVVMPIDSFADPEYYERILELPSIVEKCGASLTLLGVKPNSPSGKYGYILPSLSGTAKEQEALPVVAFVEKPSSDVAKGLIEQGALWNCGVFAFKLGYLVDVATDMLPDFPTLNYLELVERYEELPKTSFDYAVVEKAESVCVVAYNGKWKDLGTWGALTEEMLDRTAGNVVVDDCSAGTYAINELYLPMVVSGIKDAVVVATPDGILVCSKESSSRIKPLVEKAEYGRPMYEKRQWGEYRVLDSSSSECGRTLVKELIVKKGRQLSYQRHQIRSEVWTIASGFGEVVLDGEVSEVCAGSVVNVEPCQLHAIRANEDLHIYEVQLGDELTEDDIERFGYWWGE